MPKRRQINTDTGMGAGEKGRNQNQNGKTQNPKLHMSKKKKKRRYNTNEELPQFLDAESCVTASKFGARRLPEIKSLWRSFLHSQYQKDHNDQDQNQGGNGSGSGSGSADIIAGSKGQGNVGGGSSSEGASAKGLQEQYTQQQQKQQRRRRRTNLEDVTYFRSGGCKSSNRHLRRRTGSHNRRKRHRYPSGVDNDGSTDADGGIGSKIKESDSNKSRRARRKPSLLRTQHGTWKTKEYLTIHRNGNECVEEEDVNQSSTAATINTCTPSHWLETHLWHSKRFHMTTGGLPIYNNWCVPLCHTNRGTRAALRLVQSKSTIQDATWEIGGQSLILQTHAHRHEEDDDGDDDDDDECQDALIHIVEKICGGSRIHSAPFLSNEKVLMGLQVGYGFIYDPNIGQFPSGVIGPASFLFGRNTNRNVNNGTCTFFVRILIEGSVINQVKTIIRDMVEQEMNNGVGFSFGGGDDDGDKNNDNDVKCLLSSEAMTLIRVRGLEATKVITRSLEFCNKKQKSGIQNKTTSLDWNDISKCDDLHKSLPHGTIMKTTLVKSKIRRRIQEEEASSSSSPIKFGEKEVDEIHDQMIENETSILTSIQLEANDVILISHAPNQNGAQTQKRENVAVSGWDILCPPTLIQQLFSTLNMVGGACTIGLTEDACLKMDANPPIPIWPRDYPDTETGRRYWSSIGHGDEWRIVRYCIEEGLGGGKIQTGLKRLMKRCNHENEEHACDDGDHDLHDNDMQKVANCDSDKDRDYHTSPTLIIPRVDWKSLLDDTAISAASKSIVVVRGNFTAPFIQALHGFAQDYIEGKLANDTIVKTKRRPRRKVRGTNEIMVLPPCESNKFAAQQQVCENLLASLSIPALLRCHIEVEGKGVIHSGMKICSWTGDRNVNDDVSSDNESSVLGYIASGRFSQRRGKFHGIGFVSSRHFLSYLKDEAQHGSFLVRKNEGSNVPSILLKVCIQSDSKSRSIIGSLAILT